VTVSLTCSHRAVARYAGLTGSPDENGAKRREKGLARSGNARVRRGMIQLAWRFLMFQQNYADPDQPININEINALL
jgi:hypothetical protein